MADQTTQLQSPFSLEGEVAIITGGGTGLGFAMAKSMIASGARVVITGRREGVLVHAAAELGESAFPFVQDVSRPEGSVRLLAHVSREVGDCSILINNAGTHLKKPLAETTSEDFQAVLATQVHGAFHMSKAAAPFMRKRGHGSIVFIASMTSVIGMPNVVGYSAAKAAFSGMTRALAVELGPENIRVNAIAPGWIETPMLHKALDGDAPRKAKILGRTPQARFGHTEDIGFAAVYLCSPAARFINGVILPVDGGASIGF
jgi:NAD(P)-dependent dehydrogenase (short-subunit alcohol dehydrogenase family)